MRRLLERLVYCAALTLAGCDQSGEPDGNSNSAVAADRWYQEAQLSEGQQVFAEHCATCHGDKAQGLVADWKQRLSDGSLPPPPLNGSAHAWHHPLPVLLQVVNEGGIALGGKMPAFDEILQQSEKLAAIAWFQSFWSDDIYQQWEQMGGVN